MLHRRGRLATLLVTAGVVLALVPATATAAGAAEVLDRARLAQQVGAAVASTYPDLPVSRVQCTPKKVKRKPGATATCTVAAGSIPALALLVTVGDKRGNVTITSTQAVIPKANAEYLVTVNATLPVTADCGPDPYIVRLPGEPFTCTATFADGTQSQVTVTPADTAGNATISAAT